MTFGTRFGSVMMAVVVAGLLVGYAPVATATATTDTAVTRTPFGPYTIPGCTEPISIEGEARQLIHFTQDNNGLHFKFLFGMDGTGVGTATGAKYRYINTGSGEANINGIFPVVITNTMNSRLVTSGSNNNEIVHVTFHTTLNENGDATSTVVDYTADCQ